MNFDNMGYHPVVPFRALAQRMGFNNLNYQPFEQQTFCPYLFSRSKRQAFSEALSIKKRIKYCPVLDDLLYTGTPASHHELEYFASIKNLHYNMAYFCHNCRCWLKDTALGMAHVTWPTLCRHTKPTLFEIVNHHHADPRITPFSAIRNNLASTGCEPPGNDGLLFCPGCATYVTIAKNCLPHHWAYAAAVGRCPVIHSDPIPGTCLAKPSLYLCPECDSEDEETSSFSSELLTRSMISDSYFNVETSSLRAICRSKSRHTEKWGRLVYMLTAKHYYLSTSNARAFIGLNLHGPPLSLLSDMPLLQHVATFLGISEPNADLSHSIHSFAPISLQPSDLHD